MANEILSKDELDALMDGVNSGAVDVDAPAAPGEVRVFDFAKIGVSGQPKLPDLSRIHERCVRHLRDALAAKTRCACEIEAAGAELVDYAGYVSSLRTPACLHLVKAKSLRGNALVSIEPILVYAFVDHFFGGKGLFKRDAGEREFSPSEYRVAQLLLQAFLEALSNAWQPFTALAFEAVRAETNPQLAGIAAQQDAVVVSRLRVAIDKVEGEIHLAMPGSMFDPLRDHLGVRADGDGEPADAGWQEALREEVLDAELELASNLVRTQIRIGDVMKLRAGDVIPIDLPDLVTLEAEQVPLFHSRFGTAGGYNAVRVVDSVSRRARPALSIKKEIP
ncbi:MAG: flagellar motor switch protein FliM [Dokdonella sp.]